MATPEQLIIIRGEVQKELTLKYDALIQKLHDKITALENKSQTPDNEEKKGGDEEISELKGFDSKSMIKPEKYGKRLRISPIGTSSS